MDLPFELCELILLSYREPGGCQVFPASAHLPALRKTIETHLPFVFAASPGVVSLYDLRDRATQQFFAAECHAQATELVRFDLMLRAAIEAGDLTRTVGQLLGDPGHLFFGHVLVVAIERLSGDGL